MRKHILLALLLGLAITSAGCGDDEKSPCEAACDASARAKCPNDAPKSECVAACKEFYDSATCRDEARALVKCAAKATWICDEGGESVFNTSDCQSQSDALDACQGV